MQDTLISREQVLRNNSIDPAAVRHVMNALKANYKAWSQTPATEDGVVAVLTTTAVKGVPIAQGPVVTPSDFQGIDRVTTTIREPDHQGALAWVKGTSLKTKVTFTTRTSDGFYIRMEEGWVLFTRVTAPTVDELTKRVAAQLKIPVFKGLRDFIEFEEYGN